MTGYFQIPRGMMESAWAGDEQFTRFQAWVWLVENAAWKPRDYDVLGRTIWVDRGQLCVSIRALGKAWQWDKSRVERFLGRLQTEALVRLSSDAGRTVISIVEYDTYQGGADRAETVETPTPETLPIQHAPTTADTKEEVNNLITSKTSEAPKPKKARARAFVEGESMHPDFRRIAEKYDCPDIDLEWQNFRDWHLAKGQATSSMGGSASTWLRRAVEFGRVSLRTEPSIPLLSVIEGGQRQRETQETQLWRARLSASANNGGHWEANSWGPRPGEAGCQVPEWLIAQYPGVIKKIAL